MNLYGVLRRLLGGNSPLTIAGGVLVFLVIVIVIAVVGTAFAVVVLLPWGVALRLRRLLTGGRANPAAAGHVAAPMSAVVTVPEQAREPGWTKDGQAEEVRHPGYGK